MKVKNISRTANIAWSPAEQNPIYIAAGTAAQQLDASFSTSSILELFSIDLSDQSQEAQVVKSIEIEHRLHKLVWGKYGQGDNGTLIGGADNGKVLIWSVSDILKEKKTVLHCLEEHQGSVTALDFSLFQPNLIASGAGNSDIFIWDLNNIGKSGPMTPGSKSQPLDDVSYLQWNRQVQHILGSTFSGRTVVWDLRKNEPIIKITDSMSRIKSKYLEWHPDVSTQLCLASDDDHSTSIQMWDLRFLTSPIKTLESHNRGILSMAWCSQDSELLLSCGKDNRILCWNPYSQAPNGEVVYEIPNTSQWSFDLKWCPRNPAIFSSCSFEGNISIHALLGKPTIETVPTTSVIDQSFPNQSNDPFVLPTHQNESKPTTIILKKAPKWLKRPCGASFAFGGKLVAFKKSNNSKQPTQNNQNSTQSAAHQPRLVTTYQLSLDFDFVQKAELLESNLEHGNLAELCMSKSHNALNTEDAELWKFVGVHFGTEPRINFLKLLGYDIPSIQDQIHKFIGPIKKNVNVEEQSANQLNQLQLNNLPEADAFDQIGAAGASSNISSTTSSRPPTPLTFTTDRSKAEGLITSCLLVANVEAAVNVCLNTEKYAEALLLAITGGNDLLHKTQKSILQKMSNPFSKLLYSVIMHDLQTVVDSSDINQWKETLAFVITYAKPDEFLTLCNSLGDRLNSSGKSAEAVLCFVCAGNVNDAVSCLKHRIDLEEIVEIISVLHKAIFISQKSASSSILVGKALSNILATFCHSLINEGHLRTAYNFLNMSTDSEILQLKERIYKALGGNNSEGVYGLATPKIPFNIIDVKSERNTMTQQPKQETKPKFSSMTSQSNFSSKNNQQIYQPNNMASSFNPSSQSFNSGYQSNVSNMSGNYVSQATNMTSSFNPNVQSFNSTYQSNNPNMVSNYTTQANVSSSYMNYQFSNTNNAYSNQVQNLNYYNPPVQNQYTNNQDMGIGSYAKRPHGNRNRLNSTGDASQNTANNMYQPQQQPDIPIGPPPTDGFAPRQSYQDFRAEKPWNDPPNVDPLNNSNVIPTSLPQQLSSILNPSSNVSQQEIAAPGAPFKPSGIYQPTNEQISSSTPPPIPVAAAEKETKKRHMPPEHEILQTTFDRLRNMCADRAINSQMKRKLEDVGRKLQNLYDKLSNNALSEKVTAGLHELITAVSSGDYQMALGYHAHIAASANFAEVGSFLPAIKSLLQTSQQLSIQL